MTQAYSFDEATHTYSRGSAIIPGCTHVIAHGGLSGYELVAQNILERKSQLGRAVHLATKYYDEGVLDWASIDDETKAYTEAWADFREKIGFVPKRREFQCLAVVNSMEFGMQIDAEGMIGRNLAVVEIKITTEITPAHGLQLAGYALGLPMENTESPLARFYQRKRYAVQLLPTGKAKLHEFKEHQDAEIFMAALAITRWKMKHGLLKEGM